MLIQKVADETKTLEYWDGTRWVPTPARPGQALAMATLAWAREPGTRGRPPAYEPAFYARVAEAYSRARAEHRPPTKAVAESRELGGPRSHSAAAKLVARARRMGLLPPTTKGRAASGPLPQEER